MFPVAELLVADGLLSQVAGRVGPSWEEEADKPEAAVLQRAAAPVGNNVPVRQQQRRCRC